MHVRGATNVNADVQRNVPAASKVHQRDKPLELANLNVLQPKQGRIRKVEGFGFVAKDHHIEPQKRRPGTR